MSELLPADVVMSGIPWYAWLGIFIGIMIVFGDRILWDFEVKFPFKEGVGRGKVEFEHHKKKGTIIEARFDLEPDCWHEDIDIYLKGEHVYTIPSKKNDGGRTYSKEKSEYDKPAEGDEVTVKIRGEVVLSGPLVLD